ncbi:MAG: hypothetical protein ACRDFS_06420 [Chloroflexota bacterium]
MAARIIQDYEPVLESLCLGSHQDGRFDVFLGDDPIYRAPEHQYRLPDYDEDIRPVLEKVLALSY